MSTPNKVKVADLTPNTKGELSILFQVHEVLTLTQLEGVETVLCRVVDETGIITAYFDQFASKFTVGSVFEIQNFRCKVVDHHLRLEMIKSTIVSKQPFKIAFKDLENDLSAKFYVTASKETENKQAEKQDIPKKKEESKPNKEESKPKKEEIKPKQEVKPKQKETNQKPENRDKNKEKNKEEEKPKPAQQKEKQKKEPNNKDSKQREKKQTPKDQKPQNKPNDQERNKEGEKRKYVPKQSTKNERRQQTDKSKNEKTDKEENDKQQKRAKFVPKCQEIKLADCPKYQQLQATFCVRVNLQTIIQKEKYFMCKVSDSSGSTYFQFEPKMSQHLEDKGWYRLIGFRVFKDRDYGYIATQEKHSSYELLENWEQNTDLKLLWR